MAKKRIGNQFPTQSVFISERKTDYKKAVAAYEKSGRKAQKWQINLLKPLLAKTSKGLWVHTKFGYAVPRRNGKNEVVIIRELYGLENGEQILHTAHRTTTSHTAWERLLQIIEQAKYIEGEDFTSLKASGRERIDFLKTGGKIEFRTRTSTGGLGEGFDLLVIDEAQEYTDDQETALKYVVTSSKNPQTVFCGTPPTPISSGTVFISFRRKTLAGETKNGGWAEWAVEENTNPRDVEAWYRTNPSLGTIFTERSVEDEIGTDDVDFNIQRLGLWLRYNQKSAIGENEWAGLKVSGQPKLKGKLFIGIKYGSDGTNVALSIAAKTIDDKIFVEVVDCQSVRNGNDWILAFLRTAEYQEVVVDGAGGQALLAAEMQEEKIKAIPILPTVKEVIVANSSFSQAIFRKTLCHAGQPSLAQVASNCEKRTIGSNGGFGYKSQLEDFDIALLDSAMLAHWICAEAKPPKKQKVWY